MYSLRQTVLNDRRKCPEVTSPLLKSVDAKKEVCAYVCVHVCVPACSPLHWSKYSVSTPVPAADARGDNGALVDAGARVALLLAASIRQRAGRTREDHREQNWVTGTSIKLLYGPISGSSNENEQTREISLSHVLNSLSVQYASTVCTAFTVLYVLYAL